MSLVGNETQLFDDSYQRTANKKLRSFAVKLHDFKYHQPIDI